MIMESVVMLQARAIGGVAKRGSPFEQLSLSKKMTEVQRRLRRIQSWITEERLYQATRTWGVKELKLD